MRKLLLFLLPICVAAGADRDAKNARSGALFETIARMDRHLFDAFNAHDLDRLTGMVTKDLEFFQQNDGLKNFQQCVEHFKVMFATNTDLRRELVEGSLEVYPIKNYGALEIGQQRFCHREKGKEDCAVSRFAMVWQKTDDSWKLSRIISYGQ